MGNLNFCFFNKFNQSKGMNDPVIQGYFEYLRKIQKKYYNDNLNNEMNISVSLEKKDFSTAVIATKKIHRRIFDDKVVDWYKYLYYYLYRQYDKQIPWASDVLAALDKEYFIYENKFQSMFFFEEFQIRAKPTTLKIIKNIEEYDQEIENDSDYFFSGKKKKKISNPKNSGESFISATSHSPALLPGDPSVEYEYLRTRLKEYIDVFNQHINHKDHPINIIATVFCDIFSSYIRNEVEELKQFKNQERYKEKIFKKALDITKQLQKFIVRLQIILKLFYCNTINYECFNEEKDELITSITSLVFQHDLLYQSIYDLYEISEGPVMTNLDEKFSALRNIQPEDFRINVKYCLNTSTLEYQKELLNKKGHFSNENDLNKQEDEMIKEIDDKIENGRYYDSSNYTNEVISMQLNIIEENSIIPGEQLSIIPNTDIMIENTNEQKNKAFNSNQVQIEENKNEKISYGGYLNKFQKFQIENDIKLTGYKSAINVLESIRHYHTPFEKMIIITKIGEQIIENVNDFWKDMRSAITPSFLTIDADNLMSLFIYLLIKSKLSEIAIHTRIIKQFTTTTTKLSSIGYYYTTLDASINYIEETNKDDLIYKIKESSNMNVLKKSSEAALYLKSFNDFSIT